MEHVAAWGRRERAGLTGICSPDSRRLLMEGSCRSLVSKVTSCMATRSFDVNACAALLLVKMCPSAGPRGSTGAHLFSLTYPPKSSCKSQMERKDKGSHGDPQSLILLVSCKQTKKTQNSCNYPGATGASLLSTKAKTVIANNYCAVHICHTHILDERSHFLIFFNTRKRNHSRKLELSCVRVSLA